MWRDDILISNLNENEKWEKQINSKPFKTKFNTRGKNLEITEIERFLINQFFTDI